MLGWRRTNLTGVWSYACEEGLHPGESGGSVGGNLAADEGEFSGWGCEGKGGEGGSEGHVGDERLHIERVWVSVNGVELGVASF